MDNQTRQESVDSSFAVVSQSLKRSQTIPLLIPRVYRAGPIFIDAYHRTGAIVVICAKNGDTSPVLISLHLRIGPTYPLPAYRRA